MAESVQERHDAAADKMLGLFGGGEKAPPLETEGEQTEGEAQGAQPADGETQAADGTEQAETQDQPREVEVEIRGKRYLVPEEISHDFIHQADYTRKSQDNAEMRRVLTAQSQTLVQERAFESETASERRQLAVLDAQLEQYKRIDWSTLETADLMKARAQLDQLKDARADLDAAIKTKRTGFDQKISQLSQQALEAGQKYIEQHVKDYNDAAKAKLVTYGLNEGYTKEELDRVVDPRIVVTLWKAAQWDALQASKPGITKKAQQAAPVIRPGASQPRASRIQQLDKEFKAAKGPKGKKEAMEALLSAKM